MAPPLTDPQEEAAQKAFDALQHNGKSGEQQVAAFESFIQKYDGAIVVARARSQLAELKAALPAPAVPAVVAQGVELGKTAVNTEIDIDSPRAGSQAAPPASVAPDAAAKESAAQKSDGDADATRTAYGNFLDQLWNNLARRQPSAASSVLTQAAADPALKTHTTDIEQERLALKLYGDFTQSVLRGLRAAGEQDYLELQRGKSGVLKIGKRGDFQVGAVKDDVITLDAHGVSMNVPLDSLNFATWVKLAELDWRLAPPAGLQLFVQLLEATPDTADVAKFRSRLAALDGKNSSVELTGVLSRRIARLEVLHLETLEAAADAAFAKMSKLAEGRDRAALAGALKEFKHAYGATEFAAKKTFALKVLEIRSAPILVGDGLVAYFPFDEGAGNVAVEASGNLRDAQLNNCAWMQGRFGSGLSFDGENPMAKFAGFNIKTNAVTLAAWVKHQDNTGRYERYIALSGDDAIIRRNKEGHLEAVLRINHNLEWASTQDNLENNRWYHIAVTWDGQDMKLYRDGALVSSQPKPGVLDPCTDGAVSWYNDERMLGIIDEVRVYNRALSDAEVRQLAEQKAKEPEQKAKEPEPKAKE